MIARLCNLLCLLTLILSSTACVPAVIGAGVAGIGITKSSYDRIVERSYTYPYWAIYKAAHASFDELAIEKIRVKTSDDGDSIIGRTPDYTVVIKLHKVTTKVTRVTCLAGNTVFTQDVATAAAIADHVNEILIRAFGGEELPKS